MTNPAQDEIDHFLEALCVLTADVAREAIVAAVAVALGVAIDESLAVQRVDPPALPELPELPELSGSSPGEIDGADLLGLVVQAVTATGDRHTKGMYFTPRPVAEGIAAITLADVDVSDSPVILDPTCGGGAFLLAAARWLEQRGMSRSDAVSQLRGVDLDPLAAAVSRMALGLWAGLDPSEVKVYAGNGFFLDDLFAVETAGDAALSGTFDVILGNPPFQNQLGGSTARSKEETKALRDRFDGAGGLGYSGKQIVRPYVDTAALFLLDAVERLRVGGVAMMILPQSILATNDAEPIRAIVSASAALEALWISDDAGFDAAVRVCAPMVRKGASQSRVMRYSSAVPSFDAAVKAPVPAWMWSEFAADRLGVPRVLLTDGGTIADLAIATAGFRDEYYGLAAAAREADADDQLRLITSGLIEPLDCRWGTDPCRFAKQRWERLSVDMSKLASNERVFGWTANRQVAKLLIATQTKVIEAIADPDATMVPITPVISLEPHDPESLWRLAAVLTNPVTSAVALRRTAGAALTANAIKLSAKQLLRLPLPGVDGAWLRGAELAKELALQDPLTAPSEREVLLLELGIVMCEAYETAPDALLPWWADRLGITGPVVRSAVSRAKMGTDG